MTEHTRLSSKGQIVIPKDVRDRLRWIAGTELVIEEGPAGVSIRAAQPEKRLTVDEALARIHKATAPFRPEKALSIEDISSIPAEALREHYAKEFPNPDIDEAE